MLTFTAQISRPGQYCRTVKKKELAAHPQEDSFRANRLVELSFSNVFSFAEREKIARDALISLSHKLGYRRGEGVALVNVGYFKIRQGDQKAGDSIFQIARAFANKMGDPELTGVLLYRAGMIIRNTTAKKDALDSLLKAEDALEKSGNINRLLDCWSQIADFNQNTVDNYPLAMEYLLKIIQTSEQRNLNTHYTDALIRLGGIYSIMGDHANALLVLEKARVAIKNSNDSKKSLFYALYNELGEEYRLSGRYPEAIQAYQLSIKYYSLPGPDYANESNLADVYNRMDSLRLAFQYGFRSLATANQQKDNLIISWIQGNTGPVLI